MEIVAFLVAIVALLVAFWAAWYARWAAVEVGLSTRRSRRRSRLVAEPTFVLDHVSRHRYVLRNEGTATAYDVRLVTGDLSVHEGSVEFHDFPPGHAESYLMIQPLQGRQSEIAVSWRDRPSGPDERVTQLPLDTEVDSEGQEA